MIKQRTLAAGGALLASALGLAACGGGTSPAVSTTAGISIASSSQSAGDTSTPATSASTAPASATSTDPASTTASSAVAALVDPCTLISPDEARAALGGDPGTTTANPTNGECYYGVPGGPGGTVAIIDTGKDKIVPGHPGATTDEIKAYIEQKSAKTGYSLQTVSGIGDYAVMATPTAAGRTAQAVLYFIKGSTYVAIVVHAPSHPPTLDTMTTLAQAAAARVG